MAEDQGGGSECWIASEGERRMRRLKRKLRKPKKASIGKKA